MGPHLSIVEAVTVDYITIVLTRGAVNGYRWPSEKNRQNLFYSSKDWFSGE